MGNKSTVLGAGDIVVNKRDEIRDYSSGGRQAVTNKQGKYIVSQLCDVDRKQAKGRGACLGKVVREYAMRRGPPHKDLKEVRGSAMQVSAGWRGKP